MKKDLPGVLKTVCDFTGYEVTAQQLETILPRLSFQFMAEHKRMFDFTLKYPSRKEGRDFFRKGQTGDHKNYLQDEHRAAIRAKCDAMLGGKLPYAL